MRLCILLCSTVVLIAGLSLTVHRKTNFLVNLYWDNKYSDSDSDSNQPYLQLTNNNIYLCACIQY